MESLIGNLTGLGKETHMTWRMVHDPTVETESAPCKLLSTPFQIFRRLLWQNPV